mgnify:CR=1 FL=1
MNYILLLKALYESQIKYLLCGGLAVNIYGVPRMTADIDILLEWEESNVKNFIRVIDQLSYKKSASIDFSTLVDAKIRENLIQSKNMIAFSFYNPSTSFMNLDVLINNPLPFHELWEQKVVRSAKDFSVYLISPEHLILMKSNSEREQDKQDIIQLRKIAIK